MNEIKRIFRPERGFGFVEPLDGYIFSPESYAHKFIITQMVKVNGADTEQAFAAGSTVSCRVLKSDQVTELVEGTLESGVACVTLPTECYSVPGKFLLTILVTTGSTITCVYAASGTVIGADSENVNVSEGASRAIDDKIAEINAAAATAQAAVSQVQAAVAGVPAVIASIPQDYTALSNSVGDLKSAIDNEQLFNGIYHFKLSKNSRWPFFELPMNLVVGDALHVKVLSYSGDYTNVDSFYIHDTTDSTTVAGLSFTDERVVVLAKNVSTPRFIVRQVATVSTDLYITVKLYVEGRDSQQELIDQMSKSFLAKRNLSSEDDLDNLTEIGTYAKSIYSSPANWPWKSTDSGRLNVYSTNGDNSASQNKYAFLQVAFKLTDAQEIAFRFGLASGWNDWTYVDGKNSSYIGKKIGIIGDSISTFAGYSEPRENVIIDGNTYTYRGHYYPSGNVDTVDETWWKIVCDSLRATEIVVSSVSRSQFKDNVLVSGTSDAAPAPWHDDRIQRIVNAAPDVVFIALGLNDSFSYDSAVDTVIPETADVNELTALPKSIGRGVALTICKIRAGLPNARIVGILPKNEKNSTRFLKKSKSSEIIEETYKRFGAEIIDLRKCGITPENAITYAVDSDGTHPNALGMKLMAEYIISQLQ